MYYCNVHFDTMCGMDDHSMDESHENYCGRGAPPDDVPTAEPADPDRRNFLRATAGAASAGALLGAGVESVGAHHTQNPHADRWIAADSSNYTNDSRGAGQIDWVVNHCTVGSYNSAINWFQNSSANVSAHYVISNYEHTDGAPGEVTQMVHHEDQAWHASGSNSPTIGIEHEWHEDYGRYFTDACYEASAQVCRYLSFELGVPLAYYTGDTCIYDHSGGIVGHRDTPNNSWCGSYATKSCPGPDWDTHRYLQWLLSGRFRLNNQNSGKVAEVAGVTANGDTVQQWGDNGSTWQHWNFQHRGNDQYSIINRYSGKAMEVDDWGTNNGDDVIQWDYHGGANQLWNVIHVANGYYRIINVNSGKALEVDGWGTNNGDSLIQWDYHGGANQLWYLDPI